MIKNKTSSPTPSSFLHHEQTWEFSKLPKVLHAWRKMRHEKMKDNSENPNIPFPELQPFGKWQWFRVILETAGELLLESEHQVLSSKEAVFLANNTFHAGKKKQLLTYFVIWWHTSDDIYFLPNRFITSVSSEQQWYFCDQLMRMSHPLEMHWNTKVSQERLATNSLCFKTLF